MNEETKDCTRLPVVAWKVSLPTEPELGFWFSEEAEQEPRYQHHEPLCRLTDAQSLATDLRLELNAKRLKLCAALKERNDAQALLAQKDARIAQLAAHARGKNKALANALKEIERLKREANNDAIAYKAVIERQKELREERDILQRQLDRFHLQSHGIPALSEIEKLRALIADLEGQLQAAPAERGVDHGADGSAAQKSFWAGFEHARLNPGQYSIRTAWNQYKASQEFARLNPAPATADSDVREVK